ncbi:MULTISPECIES: hypothetical protein [Haloferax]|uniref:Big-1 domain-containing protein n=1 Tax=Haloferax massiliensis TaxID=1476858 RepID=A0A0D6JWL2_9EURY|nr:MULTISPECIES: hypothetical protein [Haloferax]MDS0240798.1 hypothetical protein [Haloferax sp. S2CR25]MDS0443919.1 hypothetical protein [Haloferax sp. S2CR25-2]CQR53739.1 hypothetical protein BN996_03771 [Haloferax massiliensis]
MTHNTPNNTQYTHSPLRHVLRGLVAGAARRGSHLRGDRRGASAILGTMLAFALVVSLVAMVQVSAVPAWNQQTEFEHLTAAETDFAAFDESVAKAVDGRQTRATLDAGVDYPTRALFVSPAAGSGSLRTTDPATARISGAVATGETGTYWDGSEHAFDTQQFVYRPDYRYLQSEPSLVHEGTAQYTAYGGGEVGATQSLVDGTKVSLVFLEGDIDTATSEATTFGVVPLSAGTDYITVTDAGAPITISVPTRLSEDTWRDLLADEPNVRSIAYATGADYNTLTVELAPGKTYDLRLSRVGIDTPGALQAPAYIVDVEGDNAVVPPGASHRAVVEVRDAQNNPVPNAVVKASPGLTAESGRVVARDTGTVSTVTDSDGRATFVYTAPGSVDGVVNDEFDVVAEDAAGATVDRVTFDVQLREGGVTDPLRGLVAAVDDPGFVYADVDGNGEFDGADYRVNDTGTGGDVKYDAGTDRLVVPPSTGTIVSDRDITLAGDGVSLHVDVVATGSHSQVDVDAGSGSLAAVGVSVTSVSGQDITVTAGDEIDLSGASVTQGSKAGLSIEAGGDVDLDNAGVTVAQDSNSLRIVSTNGFVSARSADISGKGDIRIDGTDGVDLAGAGLSGVKDNGALEVASARGGVNLNGVVMLGDGDIVVDAEGNVFVVGANIASTKTDVEITSDGGMVSGREAAISAEDDVVITAAVRIYLPDSSIEDEDTPELNAPEKEV